MVQKNSAPSSSRELLSEMVEPTPIGLVLLGMHRSGTSALAGILGKCGAWVGNDRDLTDANLENPKGFFERRDIRAVCNGLLHAAGADWWRVSEFSLEAIPPAALTEQRRAFQQAISNLDGHGTWLIKEPRLCLLLPALRSSIPNAVCIHIYRNPLEVARSLQARNGFGIAEGLALWEVYNRAALRASSGHPRLLVAYEELVTCPQKVVRALVKELRRQSAAGLKVPDDNTISAFISEDLHHHRSDRSDADIFLSHSQHDLWQRLRSGELLREEESANVTENVRQHLRDLEAREIGVQRLRNQLKATEERVRTLEAQLKSLSAETKKHKAKWETSIGDLHASFSWRITAPLRALSNLFYSALGKASNRSRGHLPN